VGVLDLRSCSFISRMRGILWGVWTGDSEWTGQVWWKMRIADLGRAGVRASGPMHRSAAFRPELGMHLPAFRGVSKKIGKEAALRKGARTNPQTLLQNGLTIAKITMPIISTVGTSFTSR